MKRNPVPLLIPCHRVLHTDKREDAWGYGSLLKQELLAREADIAGRRF